MLNVQVYRAACHYSDSEQETAMALKITSSRAFNRIMLFTLRKVHCTCCFLPYWMFSHAISPRARAGEVLQSFKCLQQLAGTHVAW